MQSKNLEPPRGTLNNSKIDKIPVKKDSKFRKWFTTHCTQGAMDLPFFIIVIALLTIGLIMLFSASYPYAYQKFGDSYHFFSRQLFIAVLGVAGMLVVSRIKIKVIKKFKWLLLIATIGLLILVLFYHTNLDREEDFRRWIPLFGGLTFQPSDLAKFTLVVMLSWYMNKFSDKMKRLSYGVVFPAIFILFFAGLIYLENHLSCTILVIMIGIAMMYCGGTKKIWFIVGFSAVVAVALVIIKNPSILPGYQGDRIRAWLDKGFDPLGLRWQTNNSLYAIGSGGFFGVGLGNSKQKYLYVSEPQNDFIFSIVCEELGFIGALAVLTLFALLFIRGIKIAAKCESKFASLLVTGIVLQVAIQVLFNILVVTDTFPNTGIALPFFSYGGTALGILLLEMGVVLSVSRSNNVLKD